MTALNLGETRWTSGLHPVLRNVSRVLIVVLAAAVCAVAGALAPIALSGSVALQFSLIVCGLTAAIVIAIWLDVRRNRDWLSPMVLSGAFYLLAYVGGTLYFWFNPGFGAEGVLYLPFDHRSLMLASGLCLLAWLFFWAGYALRPFRFLPIPPLRLVSDRSTMDRALLVLYALGWIGRIGRISRGLYFHDASAAQNVAPTYGSTLDQILYVLAIMPLIAVAYLGIRRHLTGSRRLTELYWIGITLEAAYAGASGARADVITVGLVVLGVAYYTRRRFPLRAALTVAAIGVFVVFPVIFLYRQSTNYAQSTSGLQTGAQTYANQGVLHSALFGVGTTFERFSDILVPASLVDQGRRVYPIAPGTTLLWALANPIPHAIWPNKPSVGTFSGDFAQAIGLAYRNSTAIATTQVGDLYLNFGAIGMGLMLMVGGIYRELGEWLRERWRSPLVLALYAASLYPIIGSHEPIIAAGLFGTLRTLLVLAFLLSITTRFLRPAHARTPLAAA